MRNAASTVIDWSEQGLVPDTVFRHSVKRLLKKRIGELHTNDCENLADSKAAVFRCMHESAISPGWDARVRPSLVRVRTDCRHTSPPLLTWIVSLSKGGASIIGGLWSFIFPVLSLAWFIACEFTAPRSIPARRKYC